MTYICHLLEIGIRNHIGHWVWTRMSLTNRHLEWFLLQDPVWGCMEVRLKLGQRSVGDGDRFGPVSECLRWGTVVWLMRESEQLQFLGALPAELWLLGGRVGCHKYSHTVRARPPIIFAKNRVSNCSWLNKVGARGPCANTYGTQL